LSNLLAVVAGLAGSGALLFAQQEEESGHGFSGFTGFAADVIARMGEVGVGLLAFIETVFPPIPSEIVLALAGYLAERGEINFVLVIITATLGTTTGALVLYGLGAWFGEVRAKRILARLPLVEPADLDRASTWFYRHGEPVIFFGRFIPIVRSMVSIPAGAQHMPILRFTALTALGSGIWNVALISAGYALGTQFEKVDEYLQYLDYAVAAAALALVAWFVIPRLRKRMQARKLAEGDGAP